MKLRNAHLRRISRSGELGKRNTTNGQNAKRGGKPILKPIGKNSTHRRLEGVLVLKLR